MIKDYGVQVYSLTVALELVTLGDRCSSRTENLQLLPKGFLLCCDVNSANVSRKTALD